MFWHHACCVNSYSIISYSPTLRTGSDSSILHIHATYPRMTWVAPNTSASLSSVITASIICTWFRHANSASASPGACYSQKYPNLLLLEAREYAQHNIEIEMHQAFPGAVGSTMGAFSSHLLLFSSSDVQDHQTQREVSLESAEDGPTWKRWPAVQDSRWLGHDPQ